MHRYIPVVPHIRITSHNINCSTISLNTLLNIVGKNNNIILVQEVNIKNPRYTTTHPDFLLYLPPYSDQKMNCTATYISCHNPHLQVTPRPDICVDPDIQVLEVGTLLIPPIYIINIYNEKYNPMTPYTIPCSLA
jgi:exonuclease III